MSHDSSLERLEKHLKALRRDLKRAKGGAMHRLGEGVGAIGHHLAACTGEQVESVRRGVTRRPLTSLGSAFGLGVVVGVVADLLLRRC